MERTQEPQITEVRNGVVRGRDGGTSTGRTWLVGFTVGGRGGGTLTGGDGLSGFSRREPRRRNVVGGGRLLVVGGGVTVVVQYAPAV